MSPLEFFTPDDDAICGICGHVTSVAMIWRHLSTEHDFDEGEADDAVVIDMTGDEDDS